MQAPLSSRFYSLLPAVKLINRQFNVFTRFYALLRAFKQFTQFTQFTPFTVYSLQFTPFGI